MGCAGKAERGRRFGSFALIRFEGCNLDPKAHSRLSFNHGKEHYAKVAIRLMRHKEYILPQITGHSFLRDNYETHFIACR
jgi:hypothetical protein